MNSKLTFWCSSLAGAMLLSACGGGGGDDTPAPPPPPATFTVGGTASGLASGASVVLQNNGGSNLTVSANGSFTFATALNNAAAYAVTVLTQPTGQTCAVASGNGTVSSANVTNVAVTCTTNTHTVGGTVSGLASGANVVLQNNGANSLAVSANGSFTFSTPTNEGAAYGVTVSTQPSGQTCTVTNGSGTISSTNVTNVAVTCTTNPPNTYTIGGTTLGLASGKSVVLQNNGGSTLTVSAIGSFTFSPPANNGATYAVTVLTQPAGQTCAVANGSGTISSANVTNVAVTCTTNTRIVGGTVSGLASGANVVLQNNGANNLTVSANGSFTFSTPVNDGAAYAVTVLTQPTQPGPGQTCTVTNGSGTAGSANITNVAVTCVNGDQSAPTVTARTPLPTAVGAKIQGGVVTVTFSEAINTTSVNTSSFTVQGPAGAVSGAISFATGNTQAIFTPTTKLAYDATYTATLTTAVRDPSNNALAANVVWQFNTGKKFAIGFQHMCARMDDGRVKCWGRNNFGQLGYEDTQARGDGSVAFPNTNALAAVNLGAGRTAVAVAAGDWHTCAILDNGTAKCWGQNIFGELGQGATVATVGGQPNEMGDHLDPINLGAGRKVKEIAGGQQFTCARLDDDSVKCWGANGYDDSGNFVVTGKLGQGNTSTSLGTVAGDIAAAPPIDFGAGLTATSLTLGHDFGCTILQNAGGVNQVKCWGDNQWGQLGQGNTTKLGVAAGDIAAASPINLGTGRTAATVASTGGHSCAMLDNAAVKCWGLNTWGQVGLALGSNQQPNQLVCALSRDCVGDAPNEMGDNAGTNIAANSASRLTIGFRHSCIVQPNGLVKCWGSNEQGQAGIEDITGANSMIGDAAGEVPPLATTHMKTGTVIEEITAGGFHTCVLAATTGEINCWGNNDFGQLGHNDVDVWGDNAGEMGDNLLATDIGT